MRILLVDNAKPERAFFTPLLAEQLTHYGHVHACRTLASVHAALGDADAWDAIVLSGSSMHLSEPMRMRCLSKNLPSFAPPVTVV